MVRSMPPSSGWSRLTYRSADTAPNVCDEMAGTDTARSARTGLCAYAHVAVEVDWLHAGTALPLPHLSTALT